jgi:hypothetical protein
VYTMNKYSVRDFRNNLKDCLSNLPFEVIDGKTKEVIALVYSPQDKSVHKQLELQKSYTKELEQRIKVLESQSTPKPTEIIEKNKKDLAEKYPNIAFGKSLEQGLAEIGVKPKSTYGLCQQPGCRNMEDLIPGNIIGAYDEVIGGYQQRPGMLCKKHYEHNKNY